MSLEIREVDILTVLQCVWCHFFMDMYNFAVCLYIVPCVFAAPAGHRSSNFGAPCLAERNYTSVTNYITYSLKILRCLL